MWEMYRIFEVYAQEESDKTHMVSPSFFSNSVASSLRDSLLSLEIALAWKTGNHRAIFVV